AGRERWRATTGWTAGSGGEKRAAVDRESHDDGRRQLPLPPLVGAARPLSPRPSFPSVNDRSAHRPSPVRVLLLGTSTPRSSSRSPHADYSFLAKLHMLATV
uniref:Uncharacterized protein n=1 Tax=Triticum urartu TaxID=4572 RepID=A0A8R7R511_TRIUA